MLSAVAATNIANKHSLEQTRELHSSRADSLALYTLTWLDLNLKGLAVASQSFALEQLTDDQQQGFLRLLFRQFTPVNIALIADQSGAVVSGPVYAEGLRDIAGGLQGHEIIGAQREEGFLSRVPLFNSDDGQVAVGDPYLPEGTSNYVVPVSILAGGEGALIVAVELSLKDLEREFLERAGGGRALVLLFDGKVLAGEAGVLVEPGITTLFETGLEGELDYQLSDGTEVFGAFSSVGELPWSVVVAVPKAVATKAGDSIRERTWFMFGLAIIMASALGVVGARQLAKPIVGLKDAALCVAEGDYGLRLGAKGGGEVAELTRAFNFMSSRLASDREKIATKNREIKAFNEVLQAKVVERTAALEEAHERLVESSRMAAVAQMGAGLAHELNNPVAGILGLSQLGAIKGAEERGEYLRKIELEALRCREVLRLLARFSSGERSLRMATNVGGFLSEVLSLIQSNLAEGQVDTENRVEEGLEVELDRPLMAQALTQLFLSLRSELLPGGTIVLESGGEENHAVIVVRMVGEQRPRGDDWLASGMGFWVARYAMQEHGGSLVENNDESNIMYELHFNEREEV